ncbi:MAG: holo-ACP synthase [Gammaproteobacteria bacterium]|nr:holo-ACP synthase [Gammaproteobacteria bacterium]
MIIGIGVDIVEISRIKALYEKYGERFSTRILCAAELKELSDLSNPVLLLAKRFAAKEAASKALGTGMRDGIGFQSFEVAHDALGKPELIFHDAALKKTNCLKMTSAHLSISDEKKYAVGFVTLEAS